MQGITHGVSLGFLSSKSTYETNSTQIFSNVSGMLYKKGGTIMVLRETEETNQFTFEAFAAHAFYTEINRSLVRKALAPVWTHPVDRTLTLLDMACGTG